jgi:hypothetical protein
MNDIVLVLALIVDVIFLWMWLQRLGREHLYNLYIYCGGRRLERVNGVTGMNSVLECAEDWFMAGAERVMIYDEHGMCKKLLTRDDYEKEGSIYFH